MEQYTWYQWAIFFYLYCFLGWIFESLYVSFRKKCLINRGFIRLPLLTLYGVCALTIVWVTQPFETNPILIYLLGILTATQLEYITGFLMEQTFHMKYWNYSDQHFHLQGHICLSSSIAWGFLSLFLTKILHPMLASLITEVSASFLFLILLLLTPFYLADLIHAVRETQKLLPVLAQIDLMSK